MQTMSHEAEKRVTPVFLCPQAEVLADTTRLAVLQSLMEEPKHVGELNAVIGVEQSLLSHYLKVLREEAFVEATQDGNAVLYRLAPAVQRVNTDRPIDLGCCLLTFD